MQNEGVPLSDEAANGVSEHLDRQIDRSIELESVVERLASCGAWLNQFLTMPPTKSGSAQVVTQLKVNSSIDCANADNEPASSSVIHSSDARVCVSAW